MLVRTLAVLVAIGLGLPAAAAQKTAASKVPAACANLTAQDKQILEKVPREAVIGVQKLLEVPTGLPEGDVQMADAGKPVLRGVTIFIKPVQGLTVERLRYLVTCGLARANAADPTQPTDWPRTPPGTTPYVYSGGDKFLVDLRSRDAKAAEEMWRTAQSRGAKTIGG